MKKPMFRVLMIIAFTFFTHLSLHAQPGDPGDPGDDPDKVPLDPGSWVLVAAGVGYGVKKWKDSKQKTENKTNDVNDLTNK